MKYLSPVTKAKLRRIVTFLDLSARCDEQEPIEQAWQQRERIWVNRRAEAARERICKMPASPHHFSSSFPGFSSQTLLQSSPASPHLQESVPAETLPYDSLRLTKGASPAAGSSSARELGSCAQAVHEFEKIYLSAADTQQPLQAPMHRLDNSHSHASHQPSRRSETTKAKWTSPASTVRLFGAKAQQRRLSDMLQMEEEEKAREVMERNKEKNGEDAGQQTSAVYVSSLSPVNRLSRRSLRGAG